MENQDEKKYFRTYKDGKTCFNMVDVNLKYHCEHKEYENDNEDPIRYVMYKKYKPCKLELQTKELIALNPTVDKSYGYKYTYKIVPDQTKRFRKFVRFTEWIHENELITDTLTTIKDN
jgi:hypothetical protein